MTNDAGVPGAPRFDVVLRGYDRRQVDEHVDRLQRVLARMRSDLEIVRSQPLPAVQPGQRPDPNRPRPTPRPRPGAGPDTIGNFTDRMQSILAEAEAEAAEIRRNAHAAARAEVDGVRSQVADLMRQRDGVLGELTRMRSQLEGMLAAPTTQMQARAPQGARPQASGPDQFRGPSHPHAVQPPAAQPASAQAQPAPSQPVQPSAAQPAGSQAPPSQPQVPRAGAPSQSPQPAAVAPPSAPVAPASAGEPTRATPTPLPSAVPPSAARSSAASNPAASNPAGSSAGLPGADLAKASAVTSAATPSENSAAPTSAATSARPERAAGKAAHRLPTGAYPAVAESEPSSLRPRTEPQIEPADLFRPTSDGRKPETRGAGEPREPAADTAGPDADRTAMVPSVPGRAAQPSKPGGAETTTVVGAVRPQDTTLIAHAPGPVSRSDKADTAKGDTKGEAAKGSTRNGSPSRSA